MSWCVEGSTCEYRPPQGKGWLATLYRRAVVNLAGSRRRFYSSHTYLCERHLSLLSSSLTPLGLVALHRLYSASHCAFDFARIMTGWDEERAPDQICFAWSTDRLANASPVPAKSCKTRPKGRVRARQRLQILRV